MDDGTRRRPRLYVEVDDLLAELAELHAKGVVSRTALASIVASVYDVAVGAAHVRGARGAGAQPAARPGPPQALCGAESADETHAPDARGAASRTGAWPARPSVAEPDWPRSTTSASVGAPERPASVLFQHDGPAHDASIAADGAADGSLDEEAELLAELRAHDLRAAGRRRRRKAAAHRHRTGSGSSASTGAGALPRGMGPASGGTARHGAPRPAPGRSRSAAASSGHARRGAASGRVVILPTASGSSSVAGGLDVDGHPHDTASVVSRASRAAVLGVAPSGAASLTGGDRPRHAEALEAAESASSVLVDAAAVDDDFEAPARRALMHEPSAPNGGRRDPLTGAQPRGGARDDGGRASVTFEGGSAAADDGDGDREDEEDEEEGAADGGGAESAEGGSATGGRGHSSRFSVAAQLAPEDEAARDAEEEGDEEEGDGSREVDDMGAPDDVSRSGRRDSVEAGSAGGGRSPAQGGESAHVGVDGSGGDSASVATAEAAGAGRGGEEDDDGPPEDSALSTRVVRPRGQEAAEDREAAMDGGGDEGASEGGEGGSGGLEDGDEAASQPRGTTGRPTSASTEGASMAAVRRHAVAGRLGHGGPADGMAGAVAGGGPDRRVGSAGTRTLAARSAAGTADAERSSLAQPEARGPGLAAGGREGGSADGGSDASSLRLPLPPPYARSSHGAADHDDDDHGSHVEVASVEVRPPTPTGGVTVGGQAPPPQALTGATAGVPPALPGLPPPGPRQLEPIVEGAGRSVTAVGSAASAGSYRSRDGATAVDRDAEAEDGGGGGAGPGARHADGEGEEDEEDEFPDTEDDEEDEEGAEDDDGRLAGEAGTAGRGLDGSTLLGSLTDLTATDGAPASGRGAPISVGGPRTAWTAVGAGNGALSAASGADGDESDGGGAASTRVVVAGGRRGGRRRHRTPHNNVTFDLQAPTDLEDGEDEDNAEGGVGTEAAPRSHGGGRGAVPRRSPRAAKRSPASAGDGRNRHRFGWRPDGSGHATSAAALARAAARDVGEAEAMEAMLDAEADAGDDHDADAPQSPDGRMLRGGRASSPLLLAKRARQDAPLSAPAGRRSRPRTANRAARDIDDSTDDLVRLPAPWEGRAARVSSRPIPSSRLQRSLRQRDAGRGLTDAERARLEAELAAEIPTMEDDEATA